MPGGVRARTHAYLVQSTVLVIVTQSDSASTVPPRVILQPMATTKKKVTQCKHMIVSRTFAQMRSYDEHEEQ